MRKYQRQLDITIYKGYQLRHSLETGHVTIYFKVCDKWTYWKKRTSMTDAKKLVDKEEK